MVFRKMGAPQMLSDMETQYAIDCGHFIPVDPAGASAQASLPLTKAP
jgi:hypothetical protein